MATTEAAISLFRSTRPFFAEFIPKGTPSFFGVDKRINPFAPKIHYLARGSPVLLADRNWRTVANDSEDFGTDDVYNHKSERK